MLAPDPDPAPVLSPAEGSSVPRPASKRRGAPRGNLNALRNGAHSRQLAGLVDRVLADPDLRRLIEVLAGRPALRDHRLRRAISAHGARARRATAPASRREE